MNGCFSKLALSAMQVCPKSRASLHAAFSKFAQRPVQACAATLPNLRSTNSKLALGVGHGGKEEMGFQEIQAHLQALSASSGRPDHAGTGLIRRQPKHKAVGFDRRECGGRFQLLYLC